MSEPLNGKKEPVPVPDEALAPIQRLVEIMRILRSDRGCPWDREQSLDKLKTYLVEEAYEVLDAIDGDDRAKLCDELGDLLLQVVFQAQLCSEEKAFTFDDVAQAIVDKLIRRHPHVFGHVEAADAGEVLKNWDKIKKTEGGVENPRSTVEGIPRHLPALHRAHLLQKRVARVGFDWESVDGALAKVEEELAEVKQAMASANEADIREELGDLLFATVNVSRFFNHNAEDVLHDTIKKFSDRFQKVEIAAQRQGRQLQDCTLAELDAFWDEAKQSTRVGSMP